MWSLTTADGKLIEERDCHWDRLPEDARVSILRYRTSLGREHTLTGFEAYGFQRWSLEAPDGHAGHGAQLIGVSGQDVTIVEIDEVGNTIGKSRLPLSLLTYSRSLLRSGDTSTTMYKEEV